MARGKAEAPSMASRRSKKSKLSSPDDLSLLYINETAGDESRLVRRVSADDMPVEEWWKTNVDKVLVLMKLCMRVYDWDNATAKKVLKSYRQFLVIKREHRDWDSKKFTPCWSVDQMWKEHSTLDHYDVDMSSICGLVLHRECPSRESEQTLEDKMQRYNATLEVVESRFATSFDSEIWTNIQVSFYDQIGDSEFYHINALEPMSDYFDTFARKKDDDVNCYCFQYNGREIQKSLTPYSLGMLSLPDPSEKIVRVFHKNKVKVCIRHRSGLHSATHLIWKDLPLSGNFNLFCEDLDLPRKSLVFTYNGKRIYGFDTAITLKLNEDDIIDAVPSEEYVDSQCICCQDKHKF